MGTNWAKLNLQLLTVFAPLLLVTGVLGFLLPAELSLMSGATPYNVFHLLAGAVGLLLVLRRATGAAITFNLIFGCIDLYQAVAGLTGWSPARLFALQPADHVVHVLVGAVLVVVGYMGRKTNPGEGARS